MSLARIPSTGHLSQTEAAADQAEADALSPRSPTASVASVTAQRASADAGLRPQTHLSLPAEPPSLASRLMDSGIPPSVLELTMQLASLTPLIQDSRTSPFKVHRPYEASA
jgi:hypothetical protein